MPIARIEKTDTMATLTTWVYCAMWQLFAAEKEGYRAHINWPRVNGRHLQPYSDGATFARIPNMYDWYFEQPHFEAGVFPSADELWTWEAQPGDKHAEFVGRHCVYGLPMPELKAFYRKNFRLNAEVNRRGAELAAKYNIDFSRTIAVTWRGTDCTLDGRPRMPIETYFPFIDDILKDDPGLRILATAEEEKILDPLLQRYPNAFTMSEWVAAPFGAKDNPEKIFHGISGYERGMQPCLMVYILSRVKHLIKNRSSVASVASWLSEGNIVCLAHPENLGHGFDITKAEINGQLYPLNR